jgi:hypothetical protein
MKVNSKIYKGIEYVQLNELPSEQKERITESLHEEALIKILIDEKVVSNCIQYRYYELWFDTVYRKVAATPAPVENTDRVPDPSAGVAIALGKV